ncbi:MAG: NAD(P)/FAD-dependent oxidoreductase [Oscillospiraceae bacterium]|nr:NAD(P)/FAD-dependent oxidoreductase [Oscillospiraceae bacterium]
MDIIYRADVAIIGAGAAGLMAACAASTPAGAGGRSFRVVLVERNDRPGRKLSITGKGRCNITNNAEKEQFMLNIPGNGKFLFSAFKKMSNKDIVTFFEGLGVGVALERGGRYFTKSGSAREVTDALAGLALRQGVKLLCGERVASIRLAKPLSPGGNDTPGEAELSSASGSPGESDYKFIIELKNNRAVLSRAVIIATGGIAYPSTGSTGDGYRFAESLGHTVVPPRPSLVPLETLETWPGGLSGLTLKNVTLKVFSPDGKKLFSKLGEMLFTHFGISGPLVLSASRAMLDCGFAGCTARIDLKPGLSDEKLRDRISRDFAFYARKSLKNAMVDLLPSRLIPVAIACAGLDPERRADTAGKAGIAKLSETLKGLPLTISAPRPASEAIVTAGGIKTPEINPSTMESKLVPGLYFCGEVIDVDAYTGGFNLSIAFATAHAAGTAAAHAACLKDP